MNDQDQAYLEKGTEVSAKFKGAFCEAKIKEIDRKLSLKVTFKSTNEQLVITDQHIKQGSLNLTQLKVGQLIEACKPTTGTPMTDSQQQLANYEPAIINKITDLSIYTVIFNDGDEKNLKRSFLRVKGERHFLQSETLNNSPLTHPEHFLNPVKNSEKNAGTQNTGTTDNNKSPTLLAANNTDSDNASSSCLDDYYEIKAGSVVIVDKKKSNNWYIGIVIKLKTNKDCIIVRNFKTSKMDVVGINDVSEYDHAKIMSKCGENQQQIDDLKELLEQVNLYINKNQLPKHIQQSDLNECNDTSTSESSSDDNDEYELEKKDRFVAQLYKFMDDRDTPINKIPTIEKTDLDLYKLFMIVKGLGGYNKVNKQKYWLNVYKKLGLTNSSSSNIVYLKSAYKRYLQPYEEFYRKLGSEMLNDTHHTTIRGSTGSGSVDSSSHRSLHIYKNRVNNPINDSKKVYKLKRMKKVEETAVPSGKKLDMSELDDKSDQKEEVASNKEKEDDKSNQQMSNLSIQDQNNQQNEDVLVSTSANQPQNDDIEATTLTNMVKSIDEVLKRNRKQQQQQQKQHPKSNSNNNKKKQQHNLSVESNEEIQVDATIEDTKQTLKIGDNNEPDVECDVDTGENLETVDQVQSQQDDNLSLKRKSKDSSDDQNRSANTKQQRKGLNSSATVAKRQIQSNVATKKSTNNDSNNETNSDFTNSSRKSSVNEDNNASSTNNNEPTTASTSNTVTLSSLYEDISSPDETNNSSIASNNRVNRTRANTRQSTIQQIKADSSNKSVSDDYDEQNIGSKRTDNNSDNSTIEDFEETSIATTTATVTSTKIDNKNYTINDFEENLVIEVKYGEAKNRKYYQAKIVKINYDEQTLLVHYRGWNTRYDEWICIDRITKIYNGDPNAQRSRKTSVKKYTKVSEIVENKKKNASNKGSKTTAQKRNLSDEDVDYKGKNSNDDGDADEDEDGNGDEEDNVDEDDDDDETTTIKGRDKMNKKCENIKKSVSLEDKNKTSENKQQEGAADDETVVKVEKDAKEVVNEADSNEKSVKNELISIKNELMDVECDPDAFAIIIQQTQNEAITSEPITTITAELQEASINVQPATLTTPAQVVKKREARSKSVDFEQKQHLAAKSDFGNDKDQLKRKLSTSPSAAALQTNNCSSSQQEPNTQTEAISIDPPITSITTATPSVLTTTPQPSPPSITATSSTSGAMNSRKKRLLKDLEASNITTNKRKADTEPSLPTTNTETATLTTPTTTSSHNTNKPKYEIFKPLIKMTRKDSTAIQQHQVEPPPTQPTTANEETFKKHLSQQQPVQQIPVMVQPPPTTPPVSQTPAITTSSTTHSIINILNSPICNDKILKTNLIIDKQKQIKQQNTEIIEHEQTQQQQIESNNRETNDETITLSTTTTTTITVLSLNPIEMIDSKKESQNESDQHELTSPNKYEQSENIQPTTPQQHQQQLLSNQNQSTHINNLLLGNIDHLLSTKSLEKSIFGEDRIRLIEEQMKECRKTYLKLKSEIMVIDKKKKRHRRKLFLKQQANQSCNKGIESQSQQQTMISTPLKQLIDATMVE